MKWTFDGTDIVERTYKPVRPGDKIEIKSGSIKDLNALLGVAHTHYENGYVAAGISDDITLWAWNFYGSLEAYKFNDPTDLFDPDHWSPAPGDYVVLRGSEMPLGAVLMKKGLQLGKRIGMVYTIERSK